MEVDSYPLLWHWRFELTSSFISLLVDKIETISPIVGSWSWLQLVFDDLSCILLSTSVSHRLEYARCSWDIFLHWLRIVVAYTWVRLFEVNVDRNWLDIVERILLVERKRKFTLWIKFWNLNMLLNWHRVILPWTHLDRWVNCLLISSQLKPIRLRDESVQNTNSRLTFRVLLILNIGYILISPRSWILIEIFLKLNFGFKSPLFVSKLVLFPDFLARV